MTRFTKDDVAAMDRVLAEIDAKMAACPEGARCCQVRNEDAVMVDGPACRFRSETDR